MSDPNTLSKSVSGHLITLVTPAIAWAITNGYLDQDAADFIAQGLEPVIEGAVALLVFAVTYAVQRFLRAKGLTGLADAVKSTTPALLLMGLVLGLLTLPSCEFVAAAVTLDPDGTPVVELRPVTPSK